MQVSTNPPPVGSLWVSKTDPSFRVVIEDAFIDTEEAPPMLIVDAAIDGDEIGLNLTGDEWNSFVADKALTLTTD